MLNKEKYDELLKSLEYYRVQTDTVEYQPSVVKKAHKAIVELLKEIETRDKAVVLLLDRISELSRNNC